MQVDNTKSKVFRYNAPNIEVYFRLLCFLGQKKSCAIKHHLCVVKQLKLIAGHFIPIQYVHSAETYHLHDSLVSFMSNDIQKSQHLCRMTN